jgi:hypothetical protein
MKQTLFRNYYGIKKNCHIFQPYIDDVLSINNHNFHNYVHLTYLDELEKKGTTESNIFASYLDFLFDVNSTGRLTTTLYDKSDDFKFAIVKFPFRCSNMTLSPSYDRYISRLIRYARSCFVYENFSKRFYGQQNDLVWNYKLKFTHILNDMFHNLC